MRRLAIPSAADIAAMPCEIPDEESGSPAGQLAGQIKHVMKIETDLLRWSSPAGEIVRATPPQVLRAFRRYGLAKPDSLFLTPIAIEARGILAWRMMQAERERDAIERKRKPRAEGPLESAWRARRASGAPAAATPIYCGLNGCCGRLGVFESMFLICSECGNVTERNPT